jgi:hypothetical protein
MSVCVEKGVGIFEYVVGCLFGRFKGLFGR